MGTEKAPRADKEIDRKKADGSHELKYQDRKEKTLNEWLHEIAFVTSTMSEPDEPQCFQEAWCDPDLIARDEW